MTKAGTGDDEENGIECLWYKAKDGGSIDQPLIVY
jgi:hypothetical protein